MDHLFQAGETANYFEEVRVMYVYKQSEPGLWTVGYYTPSGEWVAESDHGKAEDAARRVAWLNGSPKGHTDAA